MAAKKNPNPNASLGHWRAPDGKEYPIVDAKPGTLIVLQPTKDDVACAVKRDVNQCALAQAWMRQADVPVAQIGIDKCYLPIRMGGKIVALRCKTDAATRRTIDRFDRTGKFPTEGIMLHGIPPSETMDGQRSKQKRLRQRWDTVGRPPKKSRKSIHLRSATHPARVNELT